MKVWVFDSYRTSREADCQQNVVLSENEKHIPNEKMSEAMR